MKISSNGIITPNTFSIQQHNNNVDIKCFEIPRYYYGNTDGDMNISELYDTNKVDLAQCTVVMRLTGPDDKIYEGNTLFLTNEAGEDEISPDDDIVVVNWIITNNVSDYAGKRTYQLEFHKEDDSIAFRTQVMNFVVKASLETEENIPIHQPTIFQQFEDELSAIMNDTTNYTDFIKKEVNETTADALSELQKEIDDGLSNITTITPLVAISVTEMTDTSRIYVNSSDGCWYYYNGTSWVNGGIYQATAISDKEVTLDKIDFENFMFTKYTSVDKYLSGYNTTTFLPTYSSNEGDYISIDIDISDRNNIPNLIVPFDKTGTFFALVYTENVKAYGFTYDNVDKNAHDTFTKNDDGTVTINIDKINTSNKHLVISMHKSKYYVKYANDYDGSNINMPITKFIGTKNIKPKSIDLNLLNDDVKELLNTNDTTAVITVKQDETGDYTNLNDALASLESGKKYEIQIHEGIYNVSEHWTEEQLSNANYPNGFYGEIVPDGCTIKGIGNRDNIIIHAELSGDYDWSTVRNQISTLNVLGNATLENITITAKGIRYAIHDDFTQAVDKTHNYINCKIFYYNDRIRDAFGSGARSGLTINIKDCLIEPSIGYHTNTNFEKSPTLNIENTIINGKLSLVDYNSGVECFVNLQDVKYTKLNYSKYNNATQYIKLKAFSNSIEPIITTSEFIYESDEISKKLAIDSAIEKGKPVKRNAEDGVSKMTSTDDASLFYGVAIENIAKYVYANTRVFGHIQNKGYINTDLIGLSNFNIGDKIGIVNGAFSVVTGDKFIGVIDFIVNNIGYIRIIG